MDGVTSTAKQASIKLQHGSRSAEAKFTMQPTFLVFRGCDLSLTAARFVNTAQEHRRLTQWVPAPVVNKLFTDLGLPVDGKTIPVITDVVKAECQPDPGNPGPLTDGGDGQPTAPGLLTMQALVQFLQR